MPAAAREWGLKLPRVQGLKGHSLIYKPKLPESAPAPGDQCLFALFQYKSGMWLSAESVGAQAFDSKWPNVAQDNSTVLNCKDTAVFAQIVF